MEISGEPFKENGRMYVNVLAPKGLKKVRWYSDAEYRRMYPNEVIVNDIMDFDARSAFGFGDLGFITIYKGSQKSVENCAEANRSYFRRNLTFGYYTPSNLNFSNLPSDVTPIKLTWDEVKVNDTKMKPHEEVTRYVNSLLVLDSNGTSQYQGTKDEWLQKAVTVREKSSKESHFGTKHTYTLADAEGNLYVWETGAKDYQVDTSVSLKMKVKDHKEMNGNEVTVVWYCKEV